MLLLAGLVLAALLVALLVLRTQTPPPRGVSLALPGGGSLVTLDGTSLLDAARQSALAYDRANNPLYCFLFPDAATRVAGLTWMFHRCDVRSPSELWGLIPFSNLIGFRRHLPWVLGHYDGDGTMACSFVLHPHDFSLSLGELVMLGLPSMVFLWGWTTFRRLLGLLHMDDQLRDAVAPHVHGPYYMVAACVCVCFSLSCTLTAPLLAAAAHGGESGVSRPRYWE